PVGGGGSAAGRPGASPESGGGGGRKKTPPAGGGAEKLPTPPQAVAIDQNGHSTRVIYFAANDYDLDAHAVQALDAAVTYLRDHPDATVALVGHNDGVVEVDRSTSSERSERV